MLLLFRLNPFAEGLQAWPARRVLTFVLVHFLLWKGEDPHRIPHDVRNLFTSVSQELCLFRDALNDEERILLDPLCSFQ